MEVTSSLSTHVAASETHLPTSAQKLPTDTGVTTDIAHAQSANGSVLDGSLTQKELGVKIHTSFTDSLQQHQNNLNTTFDEFQENLKSTETSGESIGYYDWDGLETAYQKDIGDIVMREQDIMDQFDARFKVRARLGP